VFSALVLQTFFYFSSILYFYFFIRIFLAVNTRVWCNDRFLLLWFKLPSVYHFRSGLVGVVARVSSDYPFEALSLVLWRAFFFFFGSGLVSAVFEVV